jgi:hypothetical protein
MDGVNIKNTKIIKKLGFFFFFGLYEKLTLLCNNEKNFFSHTKKKTNIYQKH